MSLNCCRFFLRIGISDFFAVYDSIFFNPNVYGFDLSFFFLNFFRFHLCSDGLSEERQRGIPPPLFLREMHTAEKFSFLVWTYGCHGDAT
jgi:hypothetical protein